MAEITNDFSWSKTRDETFRRCPRQYYFQYYGSFGGWKIDCDERTRTTYILKQLVTRHIWAGQKVHDCIKRALTNLRRGIDPMPEAEAVETTLAIMRKDYLSSLEGNYWKNPKTCAFFEHEYRVDIPGSTWKETADHVVRCLATFYRSEVFAMIRRLAAAQWLDAEDFSSFFLDGVKVHVVLDFSYRSDSGGVVIYDWKTGRSEKERSEIQLACYTCYATEAWGVAPDQVDTVEFNLASGREHRFRLGEVGLESIRQYMRGSIRDMRTLLDEPEGNRASEERFPYASHERVCLGCNFKKVCPRWNEADTGGG